MAFRAADIDDMDDENKKSSEKMCRHLAQHTLTRIHNLLTKAKCDQQTNTSDSVCHSHGLIRPAKMTTAKKKKKKMRAQSTQWDAEKIEKFAHISAYGCDETMWMVTMTMTISPAKAAVSFVLFIEWMVFATWILMIYFWYGALA